MKITYLLLIGVTLAPIVSCFSQSDNPFFICNYKAPDFKFTSLDLDFGSFGGVNSYPAISDSRLYLNGSVLHNFIANSSKYQGQFQNYVLSSYGTYEFNGEKQFRTNLLIRNLSHNRFYFKGRWFTGFHSYAYVTISDTRFTDTSKTDDNRYQINASPAISIGFGRIEWVQYARKAVDVEKLLGQGNRLVNPLTDEQRTQLADKIAEISNIRFFDFRLGNIYKLQALDSALRELEVVPENDILYFSLLQDAFLYGRYNERLSGFTHESGIALGAGYGETNNVAYDPGSIYGFYRFAYHLPRSYLVQHDFELSVFGGYRHDEEYSPASSFPVWIEENYAYSLYPNTRTVFSIGLNGGLNYFDSEWGYYGGFFLKAYYYVSPRLQLSLTGLAQDGNDHQRHFSPHLAGNNFDFNNKRRNLTFNIGMTYGVF